MSSAKDWLVISTQHRRAPCCCISPRGLGYEPVTRWCSRVLCKKGGTRNKGKLAPPRLHTAQLLTLWRWCLHLPVLANLGDVHCPETYSKNGLARHVRIAAITTTKRALPVSESNGPFPCPSPDIELSWRLGSNQTLCLARQCPHRCALW